MAPGLYVVATPIGNLDDLSPRAAATLAAVDLVVCEDTRVTGRLLAAQGIRRPLSQYHEHNAARARPLLVAKLVAGARLALTSDAGTPLISDPGYKLVRACHEAGIPVVAVPGPSAAVAALSIAGLPSDRFLFAGFLPARAAGRRRALENLSATPATLVFYESARRLAATLTDMAASLGPREAAVCRELTKLHEEVRRGMLGDLAAHFAAAGPPKGEVVVVVAPPTGLPAPVSEAELDAHLATALAEMGVREAARLVASATGLPRRQVYARALVLVRQRKGTAQ